MSSFLKVAHKCLAGQGPLGSLLTALLTALVTRVVMDLYEMTRKRIGESRMESVAGDVTEGD